ncbi:hypothetical protein FDUTEX481_04730 [Tolypothrix sp. PCC 7601]|nr:hypothetical protein FDUTEX481_04730 [Tolypothrix sp. PCC 7601]
MDFQLHLDNASLVQVHQTHFLIIFYGHKQEGKTLKLKYIKSFQTILQV